MRIYRKPNKAIWNSIITIGSFDGVHRGHQAVIKKLLNTAKGKKSLAGVVTFEPSPQLVIHPDFHYILTPFSEKQAILANSGIDFIFLIEFTKSIQSMSPARFIQSQILHSLHPTTIVVGYDHQFGKDGQGSIELLKNLSDEFDFELIVVPEFLFEGEPIKSTRIRERLLLGDIKTANRLLGRNYVISGTVTKGLGIGKRLGFPTVNLEAKEVEKLIPAEGVYAVSVWHQGKKYLGAMNIGHRPTFNGDKRTIETSLINCSKELYGALLKIELVDRIRPEKRFPNTESLTKQIKEDIERAKRILVGH